MKTKKELLTYVIAFCVFLISSPTIASALPSCSALAIDPANGLAGNPDVKSAISFINDDGDPHYCQVDIQYSTNPDQEINIRVGLPLNSEDGGSGGVEGNWNGRSCRSWFPGQSSPAPAASRSRNRGTVSNSHNGRGSSAP